MESVNSLSDSAGFYLENLPRLAEGPTRDHHTRSRPLFIFPPAAILRGGALSGAFHPNGGRRKDMTITADFFRSRREACRRLASFEASSTGLPSARIAWRASIPSPGFSAGIGALARKCTRQ